MASYWKKINSETIFKHPRLTVVEDEVQLPQGQITQYMRYEGLKDYVTVIAEKESNIGFIKEYSYPHDEWLWQFPEGSIEPGEDPLSSADRELKEEAGLHAEEITKIGMIYSHHRRSTEKNYVFLARNVKEIEKPEGDAEEFGTEFSWIPVEEVNEMIRVGDIVQKNALSAWAVFLTHTGE